MGMDSFLIIDADGEVNGITQIVTLGNITGLTDQASLSATAP